MLANGRTQIGQRADGLGWPASPPRPVGATRSATLPTTLLQPGACIGSPVQPARSAHWIWSNGIGRLVAVDAELDELAARRAPRWPPSAPTRDSTASADQTTTTALAAAKPLLDHLGVGAVGRKLVVAPDAIAQPAQGLGDLLGLALRRAGVGNEDVGHALERPRPWSPPYPYRGPSAGGKRKVPGRPGRGLAFDSRARPACPLGARRAAIVPRPRALGRNPVRERAS